MPDPTTLPPELFTQILSYAVQPHPPTDPNPNTARNREIEREYDFHSGTNLAQLSQLTLVNRQWHDLCLPTLYSKYSHNGARHSYTSLWQFLRSIMCNPRIAAMARGVSIGNWGFYPDVLAEDDGVRGDNVQFSEGDVAMMRRAIRAIFNPRGRDWKIVETLEARILDPRALSERDCRPLVVLLLMSLPNVETVYLHLLEECLVLRYVLEEALRCQDESGQLPCLRYLVHLHLLAEVPVYGFEAGPSFWISDPALRLDDIWPCVYFSGLRTLALYDLETEGVAALLGKNSGRICRVEDLRVVVKPTATRSSADVQALVNLPQSLAQFSICWDHNLRSGEPAPEISVVKVWDALQKHRESLEQLAVFYNVHELDKVTPGCFGSLQTFSRMKRLDTQLNILLDRMTTERFAPLRVKDTIPESLESLLLHPSWVYETSPNFQTTELQAMVAQRRRPLKLLALGDTLAAPYYNQVKHSEKTADCEITGAAGSEPYPSLWTLCKQAGTQLHVTSSCARTYVPGPCEFHKGGACQWLWRKTWNMRADGIQRNRTSVERLPRPVPRKKTKTSRSSPLHTVAFTDHTGNEAFMVFKNGIGAESSKLPPLFPLVVYFTHPNAIASPDATDLGGLLRAIREASINSDFHFRLDVYFLPGASEDDCKTHYLTERASRADYETFIREFNARVFQLKSERGSHSAVLGDSTRLPGMAHSHPGLEPYRGLLLLCPEAKWSDGAQRISCVRFDKRAVQDTTDYSEGEAQNDEDHNAPESTTLSFRIAYDSPKSGGDDEETIGDWLGQSTKDIQSAHRFGDIHSRAAGMAWTSW
ncbi:uncharacterized protein APUU_60833S [Aspergillus puulaauensis]|uniref:F-box domain-containing protein n=1 Tax=Aspergillus puulaauensis TaxID=1220207 RepID=A0A7R7XU70_9EURO|nr:uncharacterized protein APUU_60833S [Aspergillus puulaauensis]BCS27785.1 hypothetical protein APUU_60833S [Aspergillus puulaauensis]